MEEDGALPDQYLVGVRGGPNHALCAAGSSQARHYPGHSQTAGPGGHLHQQGGGTSPGPIQWATSACPLTKPFLQFFWSWKKACTTSGRPPKLVRALAILLKKLFNQRFPLASPFAPTLPWTGASDAGAGKQADHAWLFGLLLLVRAVLLCAAGSASHTRILVASDNQGNVFSLLNDSTRRMPNAAILMEIVLTLHDHQVMLGPSHVKRDFNTWADELTHPDPQFPTENRVFPSVESELIKLIFATFLPHP